MTKIDAIWPITQSDLSDEELLRAYETPTIPWLRMNFISSLDGAATRDGRAGGLADSADRHVFELLRWWADVILVGAGTVRIEEYGPMRTPDRAAGWRAEHGRAEQPLTAIVSAQLVSVAMSKSSLVARKSPRGGE